MLEAASHPNRNPKLNDVSAIGEEHMRFPVMATLEILSAGICGDSFTHLPHRDQRHFTCCEGCGMYYNRRNFTEVWYHASGHDAAAVENMPKVAPGDHVRPGLRRYHRQHDHVRAHRAAA